MRKLYAILLALLLPSAYAGAAPKKPSSARSGGASRAGAARTNRAVGASRARARGGSRSADGESPAARKASKEEETAELSEIDQQLALERQAAQEKLELERVEKALADIKKEVADTEAVLKKKLDRIAKLEQQLEQAGIDDKEAKKKRQENALAAANKAAQDAQQGVKDKAEKDAQIAALQCAEANGYIQDITNVCKICETGTEPNGPGQQGCKKTQDQLAKEIREKADADKATAIAECNENNGFYKNNTCTPCSDRHVLNAAKNGCDKSPELIAEEQKNAADLAAAEKANQDRRNACRAVNGWLDAGSAQNCLGEGKKRQDYSWEQIAHGVNQQANGQVPAGVYLMEGYCSSNDCNSKMFATNGTLEYQLNRNTDYGYIKTPGGQWNQIDNGGSGNLRLFTPGVRSCADFINQSGCYTRLYKCNNC